MVRRWGKGGGWRGGLMGWIYAVGPLGSFAVNESDGSELWPNGAGWISTFMLPIEAKQLTQIRFGEEHELPRRCGATERRRQVRR